MVAISDFPSQHIRSSTSIETSIVTSRKIILGRDTARLISPTLSFSPCGFEAKFLFGFCRLLVGAPKGETSRLQNLGLERPGVVYKCDFMNEIGCSEIPFEFRGKI